MSVWHFHLGLCGDIWVPAAAKDHVNVHDLTTSKIHVSTKTTRIYVHRYATFGSVWVREMSCCQDHIHLDVFFKHLGPGCFSGLCCFGGPYVTLVLWLYCSQDLHWFSWLLLPPKATQMSRIWTDNLDHVGDWGSGCYQGHADPCGLQCYQGAVP